LEAKSPKLGCLIYLAFITCSPGYFIAWKRSRKVLKKKKTWVIRKEFKDRHREDLNKSRFINLKTK
jgi:hypothetical protein